MTTKTFPIQRVISTTSGGLQGVAQLDLSELADKLGPVLDDPAEKWKEGDANRPPVAKPTVGPHRYTIYVPHEDGTRLSLGNGVPSLGQAGMTGDTKSHIHLNAH